MKSLKCMLIKHSGPESVSKMSHKFIVLGIYTNEALGLFQFLNCLSNLY